MPCRRKGASVLDDGPGALVEDQARRAWFVREIERTVRGVASESSANAGISAAAVATVAITDRQRPAPEPKLSRVMMGFLRWGGESSVLSSK